VIALLALALSAAALPPGTLAAAPGDSVVPVRQGERLEIRGLVGEVRVRGWSRDAIQVTASDGGSATRVVRARSAVVRLWPVEQGTAALGRYEIAVPAWMSVDVQSGAADVSVAGVDAAVAVEVMRGDLDVRGGRGVITLHTVEGSVLVQDARGRIEAKSIAGNVRVLGADGDVTAGTLGGMLVLERIDSRNVAATSMNGAIRFDGVIHDDGRYRLASNDGMVTATVPAPLNATIAVARFRGRFVSQIPGVQPPGDAGRRFNLVAGNGSARLELESFTGTIILLPATANPRRPR